MKPRLISIKKISSHRTVRAVVEVEYCGIILRGLKLEEVKSSFSLRSAGRQFRKRWEEMYEICSKSAADVILGTVLEAYYSLV